MTEVQIRPATNADVPELLRFWMSAAENATRPVDTAAAVDAVIARDPDAIVGSIIAGWDGWRYHLYRLAVSPEFRRQGLGRRLLEHAEARLTALGATRIDAMVLDGNELGHSIWRSSGYVPQPEWSRWVKPV